MQNLELIGFENEWGILSNLIKNGKLPHAILLSGKKSIGKMLFAKKIALNFFQKNSTDIEEKINISLDILISTNNFPDLYIIEEEETKNTISVEQIRNLIEKLSLKSYYNLGSVTIIDDAEKLSVSASNSLLKMLEEPESNKLFILISSQPQNLMETIRSRTQNFLCSSRSFSEIKLILKQLCPDLLEKEIDKLDSVLSGSLDLLNIAALPANTDIHKHISEKIKFFNDTNFRIENILKVEDALSRKSQIIQFIRSADKDSKLKTTYIWFLLTSIKSHIRKGNSNNDLIDLQLNLIKNNQNIISRHLDLETQVSQFI